MTTLGPAGRDHCASTLGAHTGTKAMRALTVQVARLEGTFHVSKVPLGTPETSRTLEKEGESYAATATVSSTLSTSKWNQRRAAYTLLRSLACIALNKHYSLNRGTRFDWQFTLAILH